MVKEVTFAPAPSAYLVFEVDIDSGLEDGLHSLQVAPDDGFVKMQPFDQRCERGWQGNHCLFPRKLCSQVSVVTLLNIREGKTLPFLLPNSYKGNSGIAINFAFLTYSIHFA